MPRLVQMTRFVLLVVVLATIIPAGMRPASAQGSLRVAVSTPLLADIVSNVAGDRADVFSIMPESADPHTWEPAPRDLVKVSEADTFISVGASLEPFIDSGGWRRAVQDAGIPELVISDHIEMIMVDQVIDHGDHVHDLRGGDPHFWLDPMKTIEAVAVIEAHLASLDPDGAEIYSANAKVFVDELTAFDAELARDFDSIPPDRRRLIVFHDAYRYFAARYEFEVIGVVLRNPQAEVSAGELAELELIIEREGVPVIFVEPQFNTDVLDVIASEQDVVVGELLTDSFAGRVDSYIDLLRYNRDSLVEHLG
jgi:manganese/iron transport system substrate-binding protein